MNKLSSSHFISEYFYSPTLLSKLLSFNTPQPGISLFRNTLIFQHNQLSFNFFVFWVVFWTVVAVQRPSRWLHRRRLFFYQPTGTVNGSQPCLTTRDRELVSVLEVRIEPGDLNPRSLTPQSVTLPTLPRAGWVSDKIILAKC